MLRHEVVDLPGQLLDAGERAPTDGLLRDQPEPALDLVQPRGVGRRVMHVVARPPGQPGPDLGMLVRAVVVDDEMDVERVGHAGLDVAQEGEELLMTVAWAALGQDLAGGDVQGGEQGGGAMPDIIVGHALDVAESHRQHRLGALQRLDLRLFVDAQHHRMVGRVQVQADDVADLLDEERVGGQLEVTLAVRLDAEQGEPALHGALGEAGVLGHGAHAPVRGAGRLGLQGGLDHSRPPVHPRAPAAGRAAVRRAAPPSRIPGNVGATCRPWPGPGASAWRWRCWSRPRRRPARSVPVAQSPCGMVRERVRLSSWAFSSPLRETGKADRATADSKH